MLCERGMSLVIGDGIVLSSAQRKAGNRLFICINRSRPLQYNRTEEWQLHVEYGGTLLYGYFLKIHNSFIIVYAIQDSVAHGALPNIP